MDGTKFCLKLMKLRLYMIINVILVGYRVIWSLPPLKELNYFL